MSLVLEPFEISEEYLVVADFYQRKVYQLKPDSGEVRAIPMHLCRPNTLALDPSINGFYIVCVERHGDHYYYIRKKTFDGSVNEVVYNAPQGEGTIISLSL